MFLTRALSAVLKASKSVAGSTITYGLLTPIWISRWCGRIVVHGTVPSKQQLTQTGTLLIVNHPSLIETITLPALLSPWQWSKASAKPPYSVADSRLFGRHSQWLYEHFRCITVHRNELSSTEKSWRTARACLQVLTNQGVLIVYPEGGRTCKGDQWTQHGEKRVRTCNPTIVKMAKRAQATVIPVWISHGDCTQPQSLLHGYYKLMFRKKMIVTFGEPVTFSSSEITSVEVANALLNVSTTAKT